jgi:hypothetical protein
VWVWNARLRLQALSGGLRALLSPPHAALAGKEAEAQPAEMVVVPVPSAEAAATLERVAADIEAYLSKVICVFDRLEGD